ncbi:ABC transporter permease [Methylovirgula sp. 4M-Z18]|uniref:ABC transporter permease n=1 Tax=Methylovirgula sp. 4M-Z18 TaxID=2293567 RepID=UPI000E2F87F7|nr:ABC transporter permease [Methylovirgula sp. 4M-Z18]RFB78484.1 ABC transporter permease [Methylovirgula sp. 4M-Z18]
MLLPYIVRLAFRDLRGGIRGFGIFLACIALGVAAISGVNSVSRALVDGLAREGGKILGGDASFSLIHQTLSPEEQAFLQAHGSLSTVATLRAMARMPGDNAPPPTLIDLKAVDAAYPTRGAVELDPPMPIGQALAGNGIAVDRALVVRLNAKVGDTLLIGNTSLQIRAVLVSEPDKLAAGISLGPRVLMGTDNLAATGLIQPGALVRWTTRVLLHDPNGPASDAQVAQFVADANKAFPEAGWQVRTRDNVSPEFSKDIARFTQFLTLVGLTSLVVGGVGVANAVRLYVDRKRATLATLKSFGATGGTVFAIALAQVMLIACLGVVIGLVIGALLPFGLSAAFGALIPVPFIPAVYPQELVLGAVYGLLTALVFSLGPLGQAHDVPVSALFRDTVDHSSAWPRRRYLAMLAAAALALAGTALAFSTDRHLALIYIGAAFAAYVLLRFVALGLMALARRVPRVAHPGLRLALGNIHRPGALTPSVVLSLGLGLALLVTLTLIDRNITDALSHAMPGKTPSFFFLDIQSSEKPAFDAFMKDHVAAAAHLEEVPMMRGRLVKLNGTDVEKARPSDNAAWVLEGDRGITYADKVPEGSKLTGGTWWAADYSGPPLVSMEKQIADGLGLKIGDNVTVNVLGRNVTAEIANLREVNWRSFGINFVFVFSPNTFAGAPHTLLATITYPPQTKDADELKLLKDVSDAFPSITSVRVHDVLETVLKETRELAYAIRGASSIALLTSMLVLAGALAAGQRARIHDTVVLKTLGATRARLLGAYLIEYVLLGLVTALFGVLAGILAAWGIAERIMKLDFVLFLGPAFAAVLIALGVTIVLGLLGTWRILGLKPAPYLRDL